MNNDGNNDNINNNNQIVRNSNDNNIIDKMNKYGLHLKPVKKLKLIFPKNGLIVSYYLLRINF